MNKSDEELKAEVLREIAAGGGKPMVVRDPFVVDGELQARKMARLHYDLVDEGKLVPADEMLYWVDPQTGQQGRFTQYRLAENVVTAS